MSAADGIPVFLLLLAATALAQDEPGDTEETDLGEGVSAVVEVVEAFEVPRPCRVALSRLDIEAFSATRPEDVLRAVPGFVVTNHLGRGIWNWSWRGFDAQHGRDLEITLDGIPINQAAHILGNGTADLSFLPTALVDGIDLCPAGNGKAAAGWATAGSANFRTGAPHKGWLAYVGTGTQGSGDILVSWRPSRSQAGTFLMFEADEGLGAGPDRRWRDLRLMAGIEGDLGELHASAILALHDGTFDVPPELRQEDVQSGELGFRDAYRAWGGRAESRRLLVGTHLSRVWPWGGLKVHAWFGANGFGIIDNRTGFQDDERQGDGVRRFQTTMDTGIRSDINGRVRWLDDVTILRAGIEIRGTTLRRDTERVDLERNPIGTISGGRDGRTNVGTWARARIGLFRRAALEAGFQVVYDRVVQIPDETSAINAETVTPLPQVALFGDPLRGWTLHASYSRTYRPPDAGRLLDASGALASVFDTVEGSTIIAPIPFLSLEVSAWGTWSDAEGITDRLDDRLLYVAPTQRAGGEVSLSLFPLKGIRLQVDASFADARRADTGDLLPYVARNRYAVAVFAEDRPIGPVALTGSLRVEATGRRPLPGGFSANPIATLDLTGRVRWKRWIFDVALDNLAPWDWEYETFVHPSRWDTSAPADPLPVRHIVAGRAFALRLGAGFRI